MVRYSIASLGEVFTQTVNFAFERLQLPKTFGRIWSSGFLNADAKASIRRHNWRPSDIVRAEAKYHSIQTLYILRMLDKPLLPRNHSRCTDDSCNVHQISTGNYQRKHQSEGYTCHELVVKDTELSSVLLKEEKFPILKFKGDLQNLDCDIVESGPYFAISHV